jgi:hypothetical protein
MRGVSPEAIPEEQQPRAPGLVRSDVTKIGVLALQGDVARHVGSLEALGVDTVRVTEPRDLRPRGARTAGR